MTYLDGIVAFHRARAASDTRDLEGLYAQVGVGAPRGFAQALTNQPTLAVIAEIKRRSPSKGDINIDLDPALLAASYVQGGASCLSVLTDEPHFAGSAGDLVTARASVGVPVLRKDFTVSERDVVDARIMGADAVLLIVAALADDELARLHSTSEALGMSTLVEVHDEAELQRALSIGATLVGVNQRDLHSFAVDTTRAVRVAGLIPPDVVAVAESGITGADDARRCADAGYRAVLVGEHLVRSANPERAVSELRVPLPS